MPQDARRAAPHSDTPARSAHRLLWVGPADGMPPAPDRVGLEVSRVRDLADATELPLELFDVVLLNERDARGARHALEALGSHRRCRGAIALCLPWALGEEEAELRRAGAAHIVFRGRAELGPAAWQSLLALARRPPRRAEALGLHRFGAIATRNRALRDTLVRAERAAHSDATILVSGETGTGKELLARGLHEHSARAGGPFVAINCAAFPDTLLESELFGHTRGAFTGADAARKGLFEAAEGGSLFLDEVGETSQALQAKLLRAVQEREVLPLGAGRPRPVDVRVIAASNRDLVAEIEAGRFRTDLYYRLAVLRLALPPLRRRPEDIPTLARQFLRRFGERDDRPRVALGRAAQDLLLAYAWPGNIRELENEMQAALAQVEAGTVLEPEHFSERVRGVLDPVAHAPAPGTEPLRETVERFEAWAIRRALARHHGRKAATARALGLTREGLYKKMKRLGIE